MPLIRKTKTKAKKKNGNVRVMRRTTLMEEGRMARERAQKKKSKKK